MNNKKEVDIKIEKVNETWIRVLCKDTHMEMEIQDRFSFQIPNAQFDPRVRAGRWDGIIKLFNRKTKQMFLGLFVYLIEFLEQQGYTYTFDSSLVPNIDDFLETEDVTELVNIIKPKGKDGSVLTPYDYQLEALEHMLNMRRSTILSATSSGKSLIIYLLARIYQLMLYDSDSMNKKIFITVPSISLVEQMYSDFEEYSKGTEWIPAHHVQRISGKRGRSLDINKQIIITTWQSQCKMDYTDLQSAFAIIIDEAHGAKANVLTEILQSLTNCQYRHGLTGTLDGLEANELHIQGLLGVKKVVSTAADNIRSGRAADVCINMTVLNHNQSTLKEFDEFKKDYIHTNFYNPRKEYEAEVRFLMYDKPRMNFLIELIQNIDGNTLIIFDRLEDYGELLYQLYKELHPNETFLISGNVDGEVREKIRTSLEHHDNAKVFATYGTMSTGVSINKLHNAVLLNSGRSKIRVLQTIGRMMRLHKSKDKAQVYDIVDRLGSDASYSMKQAADRIKLYQKEKFDVRFIELNI